MLYRFTDEQIKNLEVFLGRTQLNGQEVSAFNEIVGVLKNPIKEEKEEKKID